MTRPRLLLMGLRRSGKSSIQNVVFHKMAPNETLFLESTAKITSDNISSFIDFQICDFPGHIDLLDASLDDPSIFIQCQVIVFVIDSQEEYLEALQKLYLTTIRAHKVNPSIAFEVFIHKVDGLSDDHKIETRQDIQQRINDELLDAGLDDIHLSFHLTSIYDYSIYESLSKVIQKLIPSLPTLENLLNMLCSNSGCEKAFLFDVISKIYIATDSSPVDMQTYEICADMIDVMLDVCTIYSASQLYNASSATTIKLNNGMVLYLRGVSRNLALVALLREENYKHQAIINHNTFTFTDAILDVLKLTKQSTEHI